MHKLNILIPASDLGGVIDHAHQFAKHVKFRASLSEISKATAHDIQFTRDDVVVLMYSGYGYHQDGAPVWLAEWAEKNCSMAACFGTFFHEIYATSAPWRRAFWFTSRQKSVATRLAKASSFVLTSRSDYWEWLRDVAGDKPHYIAPIFSNVGELESRTPWNSDYAVVFGSPAVRAALYKKYLALLVEWSTKMNVAIHDIGHPMDCHLYGDLREGGVIIHGRIAPDEVSSILRRAGWGVMAYDAGFLAKSSVFAAYAAHALCPVVLSDKVVDKDGLRIGKHYLGIEHLRLANAKLVAPRVAAAAHDWYRPHSVSIQGLAIQALIEQVLHMPGST